jgi:hypothetical protein
MKSRQEVMDVIAQANATEAYHRFSSIPGFPVITDGVLALAEAAGCYWLLDIVGSYQSDKRLCREFQVWKLEVNLEEQTAVVTGGNDDAEIIRQEIPYTDFPLESVTLFLMGGVLLLPRER